MSIDSFVIEQGLGVISIALCLGKGLHLEALQLVNSKTRPVQLFEQ
jgi:hypothetical protein